LCHYRRPEYVILLLCVIIMLKQIGTQYSGGSLSTVCSVPPKFLIRFQSPGLSTYTYSHSALLLGVQYIRTPCHPKSRYAMIGKIEILSEAEFLDGMQTKVLQVLLLAIHSHPYSFALKFIFFQTHATLYEFFLNSCNLLQFLQFSYVHCKGERRKT
jgi:hypothetical protein